MSSTDLQRLHYQKRIRFQLKTLAETIDEYKFPIEKLILRLDWDQQDLAWTENHFKTFDELLKNNLPLNWAAFEQGLVNHFGIGYDTVEEIVLAYSRTGRWSSVCAAYKRVHPEKKRIRIDLD